MISRRLISRFTGSTAGLFDHSSRIPGPRSDRPFTALSLLSPKSQSQTPQNHHGGFPAVSKNSKGQTRLLDNVVPILLGNLGLKLGCSQAKPLPGAMNFRSLLHSAAPKEFEKEINTRSTEMQRESGPFKTDQNIRPTEMHWNTRTIEMERNTRNPGTFGTGWNTRSTERNGPFVMQRDTGAFETDLNTRPIEMLRNSRTLEMERNTMNTGPLEMGFDARPTERNTRPFETDLNTRFTDRTFGMEQNTRNTGPLEMGFNTRPMERISRSFETDWNNRFTDRNIRPIETGGNTRSLNFVKGILDDNERGKFGGNQYSRYTVEQNSDIVHIKIMRNNSYVTVTDFKGNKKVGASGGLLSKMKGGSEVSRYSAEAAAEHVGRLAKNMGLKSVVVKVNGFTLFKKKKQAILAFRDGYTNSRSDQNPIVYIEDTTRRPHNGCRLRKRRRI